MLFYIGLLIALSILCLYLKIESGKKSCYYIDSKQPLRSVSFFTVLYTALFKPRAYTAVKMIDMGIERSLEVRDPMYLSWFLWYPAVIVTDLDAVDYVLKKHEIFRKWNLPPGGMASRFIGDQGLTSVNGDEWKVHRRMLNVPFTRNIVFFPTLQDVMTRFVEQKLSVMKSVDSAGNVGDLMQALTLDSLGVAVLGKDFRIIEGETDTPLYSYNYALERVVEVKRLFPVVNRFYPDTKEVERHIENFGNYISEILNQKVGYNKDSIIGTLIDSFEKGEVTEEMVRSNLVTFIIAGHETTAGTLLNGLYCLASNPSIQEACRKDISDAIAEEGEYNYEAVKKMTYLDNFIDEVLRMYPPAPMNGMRVTSEDVELAGCFIPKNTLIAPILKQNQIDPEIWENPLEFNPDRFNELTKRQKKSMLAFSGGPRVCIGRGFSLLEQKMFYTKLLSEYIVNMTSDSRFEQTAKLTVQPRDDLLKFYFTKL
eukprot:TRINITY_DN1892_c0_g1_i1.p1 TRINITY_DN1892_c0_g1~~TRINITY_DN1892_c0_g1_i1.p1  ORF type:complete len:483 (+),score=81.25 TRINITY_DN1892_c0_g1_i1:50-1498(+)